MPVGADPADALPGCGAGLPVQRDLHPPPALQDQDWAQDVYACRAQESTITSDSFLVSELQRTLYPGTISGSSTCQARVMWNLAAMGAWMPLT